MQKVYSGIGLVIFPHEPPVKWECIGEGVCQHDECPLGCNNTITLLNYEGFCEYCYDLSYNLAIREEMEDERFIEHLSDILDS